MTRPHTHKEGFPDTQRLVEKANKDKREAEGYLPQKTSKEEPRYEQVRVRVVEVGGGDVNIEDIDHEDNAITLTQKEAESVAHSLSLMFKPHSGESCSWEERFENIYRPLYLATEASVAEHFHDTIKDLLSTREKEVIKNVSMLRQWLNEDRIDDPKKMVTNEDIMTWLTTNPETK